MKWASGAMTSDTVLILAGYIARGQRHMPVSSDLPLVSCR